MATVTRDALLAQIAAGDLQPIYLVVGDDEYEKDEIAKAFQAAVPEDTGAEAVLTGAITSITVRPTAFDSQQQASRYEITVVVKVEFKDVTTTQSATADSFLGSNSQALERLATDFAKSVVTSVLEAF